MARAEGEELLQREVAVALQAVEALLQRVEHPPGDAAQLVQPHPQVALLKPVAAAQCRQFRVVALQLLLAAVDGEQPRR